MKKHYMALAALIAVAGLMTGCETSNVSTRIQEKPGVFAALTPEQQRAIQEEVIEYGYTPDMVYLALGKPSKVSTKQGEGGMVEMWTYTNYYQSPQAAYQMPLGHKEQWTSDRANRGQAQERGSQKAISNTSGGLQTNLALPELASSTLYVQFFEGKVFKISLENE